MAKWQLCVVSAWTWQWCDTAPYKKGLPNVRGSNFKSETLVLRGYGNVRDNPNCAVAVHGGVYTHSSILTRIKYKIRVQYSLDNQSDFSFYGHVRLCLPINVITGENVKNAKNKSTLRHPHQAVLAYRSCETSVARVTSHSAFHLSPWAWMVLRAYGERLTSAFSNKSWNVMVKCEGGTNGYTKYVHFIHPLYTWNGCRIGKYFLLRGRWTIISCDLVLFNFRENVFHRT